MALIGNVHDDIAKLARVTREALFHGISICKPGAKFNEIGETI